MSLWLAQMGLLGWVEEYPLEVWLLGWQLETQLEPLHKCFDMKSMLVGSQFPSSRHSHRHRPPGFDLNQLRNMPNRYHSVARMTNNPAYCKSNRWMGNPRLLFHTPQFLDLGWWQYQCSTPTAAINPIRRYYPLQSSHKWCIPSHRCKILPDRLGSWRETIVYLIEEHLRDQ